MRQHGWMKYLEDYDLTLHYHSYKENVVADELSQKSLEVLASWAPREWQMLEAIELFGLHYRGQTQGNLGILVAMPSLLSRVIES